MIVPSRMRSILASLLLVLALPGLLLPAGLAWRFCRCEARAAAPVRSCCSDAAPTPAATTAPTCCHRAQPATPLDGTPSAKAHSCGCVVRALPDLQRTPPLPDFGAPAPLPPPPAVATVAWLAPSDVAAPHVARTAESHHPPPGADRNLPLRL